VEDAVGAVSLLVVAEGLGDAEAVEGLAVDDVAAGALVGGDVEMHIGEAADRSVRVGAAERRAGRVDLGLGELRAAGLSHQGEDRVGAFAGALDERPGWGGGDTPPRRSRLDRERAAGDTWQGPFRGGPGRVVPADGVGAARGHQLPVLVLGKVSPQPRWLQVEAGGARLARVGAIPIARRRNELAGRLRPGGQAAVGESAVRDLLADR